MCTSTSSKPPVLDIFVTHVDGTGFHPSSDGTHTDFSSAWMRDGKNTPIWNRKHDQTGGFYVLRAVDRFESHHTRGRAE